jgi:hypothetical protein
MPKNVLAAASANPAVFTSSSSNRKTAVGGYSSTWIINRPSLLFRFFNLRNTRMAWSLLEEFKQWSPSTKAVTTVLKVTIKRWIFPGQRSFFCWTRPSSYRLHRFFFVPTWNVERLWNGPTRHKKMYHKGKEAINYPRGDLIYPQPSLAGSPALRWLLLRQEGGESWIRCLPRIIFEFFHPGEGTLGAIRINVLQPAPDR